MGLKILIFFIGLGVFALGVRSIIWAIKSLDSKTHQRTKYLDVPAGTDSLTVGLLILVANFIFYLLPVPVMRVIVIIMSIGTCLLGGFLVYASFKFV